MPQNHTLKHATMVSVWLAWQYPGQAATSHVIAVAQVLTSALLIHLTGGRIETHFHIFGSLAVLAFHRDWRVLATAANAGLKHFISNTYTAEECFEQC